MLKRWLEHFLMIDTRSRVDYESSVVNGGDLGNGLGYVGIRGPNCSGVQEGRRRAAKDLSREGAWPDGERGV
jgi:hypothetical protein